MSYDLERVQTLLRDARDAGATDVHLKVPGRPRLRIAGKLVQTPYPPLEPRDLLQIAQHLKDLAGREVPLLGQSDLALAFGVQKVGRFRAQVYRQRGSLAIVIHRMSLSVPSLAQLKAPAEASRAVWGQPGLSFITGERQRLDAVAAVIDAYNQDHRGSLLSLEDPLEFLHADVHALISQREVGLDTPSTAEGLRLALLSDADAVVVGDVHDGAAAELALRIAESGRTVVVSVVGCRPEEAPAWFARLLPESRAAELHTRIAAVHRCTLHESGGQIELRAGPAAR
jgi:twitching motility protein PilT